MTTRETYERLNDVQFCSFIKPVTKIKDLTVGTILWSYRLGRYVRIQRRVETQTGALVGITYRILVKKLNRYRLDEQEYHMSLALAVRCYEEDAEAFHIY